MPIYSPTGFLDITNATLRTSNLEAQNFKLNGGNIYVTSELTTDELLNLNNVVNAGNATSNTVQFTNTTTGLVADSNIVVTGNVTAGSFLGDGSGLTSIPPSAITGTLSQWSDGTNSDVYIASNVGIGNVHTLTSNTLQVGANLYVRDADANVLTVTGNVAADYFEGDGSKLTGISSTLQAITDSGNVTSNTVQFTNATTGFVTTSNIEVGGALKINTITAAAYHALSAVTAVGASTGDTIQLTNATTGLVTTGNVEVGTANLFVDTSTSNVGIGTNAPQDTLHINGGTRFAGHIIPTANATFDIGSAENKVRDLYVDTNSIWVGDRAKIAFENGKMKFKRRKINKVPRMLVNLAISGGRTDEADVETHAIAFAQTKDVSISSVSQLKLEHLRDYAKTFDNTKSVSDIFADNEEDYEAITASEAFMEVGSNIFTEHALSIGKTTDPTSTLDVVGDVEISSNLAVDTNTLFVDSVNNRVGIGTTSPDAPLHIYKREDTFGSLVELLRLERYTNDFDNRVDAAGGYIGFHANDGNAALGEVARISFRQKGESSTANAENDGGMGFWTKLNDSLAQRVTIAPNGNVGIGTTAPASPLHVSASTTATHTMRITHSDTNATSGTHALLIDANYSGTDTFTGDKTNVGVYIDLDSSATGGDTSHEHRIYGVYSDVRHSGDSDICYSGYFYARSDHTSGQCSALRGIYAQAQDSANGTNSNNTAGEFKAIKDGGSTNTTATMMGIRSEVEVDAGTVTNAYAVHGHIDRDGGTITNGYLFHGTYAGSDTGVKWGLHLSGDEKNHVDGSFGIGTDAPAQKLDVAGRIRCDTMEMDSYIYHVGDSNTYFGFNGNDHFRIVEGGGNRFQVDSGGNVGINTSSPALGFHVNVQYQIAGLTTSQSGIIYNDVGTAKWRQKTGSYRLNFERHSSSSASNYTSWTTRGYLDPNASNVRLNFTGQHRTFIKGVPFSKALDKEGLIVSANNDTYIKMSDGIAYGANAITINECLPVVTLSQKMRDKSCFGVISLSEDPETREEAAGAFVSIIDKETGDTRIFVNSVGEGGIWVVNMNGTLEPGDYITTSNVPGYGMKQDDDLLHNYTVAKITMNCDFNPKLQKVKRIKKKMTNVKYWVHVSNRTVSKEEYDQLQSEYRRIIQDENGDHIYQTNDITEWTRDPVEENLETFTEFRDELQNDLDEFGQIQWEDTDDFEKAYKIRYILPDATQISESEYDAKIAADEEAYKAAFVGCTYHCG